MELIVGKEYKRTELHDHFGGQRRGGIATPARFPYVFAFQTKTGKDFGYTDGWDGDYYRYTGEGQEGDMTFIRGNGAIRDHAETDKTLYLFQETKKAFTQLVGEFICVDYEFTQIPDKKKVMRRGIQFLFELGNSDNQTSRDTDHVKIPSGSYKKPNATERRGLVTSRVGQGGYRKELIKKFNGKCAASGIPFEEVLIASHIVPWRASNDEERLDADNGILLSPTYDALFDKHLISFNDNGEILISKIVVKDIERLGINARAKIAITEGMKKYLSRHRDQFRE